MSNSEWLRLRSYSVPHMAELLMSFLEAHGIPAKIFNTHSSNIMPHLSFIIPADVMIQKKDFGKAEELLQEFEKDNPA